MSRGRALRWLAAHLPGVDDRHRADVVTSVEEISRTASRRDRALELVSLAGFGLTASSRRGTHDSRTEMLRQGARVAALALAAAVSVSSWATAAAGPALASAALVVALAGGLRTVPVGLGGGLVAIQATAGDVPELVLGLLVLAAVAASRPFDARRCPAGAVCAAVAVVAAGIAASAWPSSAETTVLALSGALVVVFLAVGWFDPRFAVAATVVCAWRFLAIDLGDLAPALLAAAHRQELDLLLTRWIIMGAGVASGWLVTRAALARCLTTPS